MTYKIADTAFSFDTIHVCSERLLRDYRTEAPAEASIVITEADLLAERERVGEPSSTGYLESLAVLRKLSDILIEKNILLFHGSAIAVDGGAYIFAAPSGTGKSTHARLWRELLGERAVMVNDDKPFVRVADPCVVYGSPWDGKHRLSTNAAFPLQAICLLQRGKTNQIEPITLRQALPQLLQQAYREEAVDRILPLVLKLGESVPLYRLSCNMEPEAALVSWQAMRPRS